MANENGRPSLTRLGAIAEQIAELTNSGVQVIFVSSGAVGLGKRLLRKQRNLHLSFRELQGDGQQQQQQQHDDDDKADSGLRRESKSFASLLDAEERPHTLAEKKGHYDTACASAGQFEMMNLYSALFAQCEVMPSQILVTQNDFADPQRSKNLRYAVDRLLSLSIVPIINETDAVSANQGYTPDPVFSDNDSLAALCARHFGAEVLLLLADVAGVFSSSPKQDPNAVLLPYYRPDSTEVAIGAKSVQGRGGMASKIDDALATVQPGSSCSACVVAAGSDLNTI